MFTAISAVFKGLLGTTLAFLLAENVPGTRVFRFIILLPWTVPIVLSSIAWKWMFDTQYSIINWLAHAAGLLEPGVNPNWLGDPTLAIISIIAVNVWRGFPFAAMILLAGMTSVPHGGPGRGQGRRRRADHPLPQDHRADDRADPVRRQPVRPGLHPERHDDRLPADAWAAPATLTHVLSSYAFLVGVQSGALGRGAAIALLLFPILLVIVFFALRALQRRDI